MDVQRDYTNHMADFPTSSITSDRLMPLQQLFTVPLMSTWSAPFMQFGIEQFSRLLTVYPEFRTCHPVITALNIRDNNPRRREKACQLGIVASVQPVHLDPVTFDGWPEILGIQRCKRVFAYQEFLDADAHLAFGTDSPTAAHQALPNLYVATTRRSAIHPLLQDTINPEFAVSLRDRCLSSYFEGCVCILFRLVDRESASRIQCQCRCPGYDLGPRISFGIPCVPNLVQGKEGV
ncbi:unnamed protein product [Penicillium egyptiacum]|uniref:Uncharacterized protein n=1 Tax=Penicillium egyptiacum TaxID=1303716 RepID=A0A9W4KGT2_9EURO|nr:unnamed protein product [Penicillium egyptiacum]